MHLLCSSSVKRFLYLLAFNLLLVATVVLGIFSNMTEDSVLADSPSPQESDCYPDRGWTWTSRPSEPEVAAQVQQALNMMDIEADVESNNTGETDSCGSFHLFAIDFKITVQDKYRVNEATQQDLVDKIYPLLAQFGQPNLGQVELTFLPSNTVLKNPKSVSNVRTRSAVNTNWQQISTAASPPARYTHGSAYDSQRRVMVLFGGDSTGSSRLNDTWEFDGTNWVQIHPAQSPPGRANIDQTLVYDSSRRKVVLFGGLGESGHLNDTWEYDGATWSNVETSLSPPGRDSHAMVFDNRRGVTVLFGGYSSGVHLNDTWEYDGSTWRQQSPSQSPIARFHHAMAYDESRQVTVLFGGLNSSNSRLADTWEFDGTNWTQINPTQSPPAQDNHSMTYDKKRGVVVLYGGEGDSGLLNDTWEYDGTTWRQTITNQTPSARKEISLVYDEQQEKVIFFGGGLWSGAGLTVFNDTWAYQEDKTFPPSEVFERKVYVIVYDPILNNGQHLSDFLNWNDHATLTQETIDFFKQVTNQRLQYQVVKTTIVTNGWPEKTDGSRYTEEEYLAVIGGQPDPHPDMVNYNKIVNSPEFDICGKANRGEIDDVWIYNGPYFGFYESTLVGPDAFWYNSPSVPAPHDCNRLLPIMGPSPHAHLSNAIHNFGHRTESTMKKVYGSWEQNRTNHNWERFGLVDALSSDYNYSGCGSTHYPPNGVTDYDYANTSTAMTNCHDFDNYPNLGHPVDSVQPYSCSDIGCTELDYHNYWFGHFPSNPGCGSDNVANDWWKYFVDPALAVNPSSACDGFQLFLPTVISR